MLLSLFFLLWTLPLNQLTRQRSFNFHGRAVSLSLILVYFFSTHSLSGAHASAGDLICQFFNLIIVYFFYFFINKMNLHPGTSHTHYYCRYYYYYNSKKCWIFFYCVRHYYSSSHILDKLCNFFLFFQVTPQTLLFSSNVVLIEN